MEPLARFCSMLALTRMKPEYRKKLKTWLDEQVEDFKRKGATEALFDEPTFMKLLYQTALENHIDELRADPDW
jgi:hypothetical protein